MEPSLNAQTGLARRELRKPQTVNVYSQPENAYAKQCDHVQSFKLNWKL